MLPGLGKDTVLGNETFWNSMDGIDLGYWNVGDVGGITVNEENGSGTVVSGMVKSMIPLPYSRICGYNGG